MAIENVEITAGSGTPIAADKIGDDYYQVVKLGLGADGALDGVVDAGSQLSAASIPVVLASDHADVKVTLDSEAVTANLGATDNAVLDDIASSLAQCLATNSENQFLVYPIIGTFANDLGKAEDAEHTSGDTGVFSLAVRTDTPAASSGSAGDYEALHTNKVGALWTTDAPATPYKNIDVDESEDAVSANPCVLRGFYAFNNAAAGTKRYLKLYNATVATVVVGTTAPTMTFELDGGQGLIWNTPLLFTTALTVAATTGVADNDSGAPSANDVVFNCGVVDL